MRKNTPVHNAPMTLADVNGDFMVQVSVTGEMNPGDKPPSDRAVRNLKFTFESAGLVLYQDKNNFMRLERAASIFTDRMTPVHRILIEAVQDGQQKIRPIYYDIPEGDTKLIMIRRKGRIKCLFVPSGSGTVHSSREFAPGFPQQDQGRPGRLEHLGPALHRDLSGLRPEQRGHADRSRAGG